jgi:hypothetical protein
VAVVGDLGEVLAALESVSDSAQLAAAPVVHSRCLPRNMERRLGANPLLPAFSLDPNQDVTLVVIIRLL